MGLRSPDVWYDRKMPKAMSRTNFSSTAPNKNNSELISISTNSLCVCVSVGVHGDFASRLIGMPCLLPPQQIPTTAPVMSISKFSSSSPLTSLSYAFSLLKRLRPPRHCTNFARPGVCNSVSFVLVVTVHGDEDEDEDDDDVDDDDDDVAALLFLLKSKLPR